MRILNIEDTFGKHKSLRDVLERIREIRPLEIQRIEYLEDALVNIQERIDAEAPYDVIITDMEYPENKGDRPTESGDKFIQFVSEKKSNQEKGWDIPVIVFSSGDYSSLEKQVYGVLHYSENADWEGDLTKMIKALHMK